LLNDSSLNLKREDLFITSKLWNTEWANPHSAIQRTLKNLKLDFLDLYLVHSCVPFVNVTEGDGDGNEDEFFPVNELGVANIGGISIRDMWTNMEKLVESGLTKSIGISNFPVVLIRDLLSYAKIHPAVHQLESHPYNSQEGNIGYCLSKGIIVVAYSPLANGRKDGPLIEQRVKDLATKYGVTSAQILIRFNIERGLAVITKTTKVERIKEIAEVSTKFRLEPNELEALLRLDRNMKAEDLSMFWN